MGFVGIVVLLLLWFACLLMMMRESARILAGHHEPRVCSHDGSDTPLSGSGIAYMSKTTKLPRFWQEASEAAYEHLATDVSGSRDTAISEIARMSLVFVAVEPSFLEEVRRASGVLLAGGTMLRPFPIKHKNTWYGIDEEGVMEEVRNLIKSTLGKHEKARGSQVSKTAPDVGVGVRMNSHNHLRYADYVSNCQIDSSQLFTDMLQLMYLLTPKPIFGNTITH
nr:gamma-aminobutyric acid receptor alpha-like [Tanacetum cinerariifolium]